MISQLTPPIPVETPRGKGQAAFLIDYGPEQDLYWVTFLDANGECWTFNNRDVRAQINISRGNHGPERGQGKRSAA